MKTIILLSCLVCFFAVGAMAQDTNVPCFEVIIEMASGVEPVSLFSLPDGSGKPLIQAQYASGEEVDASITLTILDCAGTAIAGIPGEDLWLKSADDGVVHCGYGACADSNTDINGTTHWTQPLFAGGHSNAGCYIDLVGVVLGDLHFPLYVTSADLNGDGQVNLSDIGRFSEYFFGTYDFAADFNYDGQLNLADVGRLAVGVGTSCP